uniref:(California timema) hypothetical protein n=1 Tax=Timema californicum TaxID=61474 RepID=A0A7R9PE12_TIMCA|nr:unnamed protein product [Timema californicum]
MLMVLPLLPPDKILEGLAEVKMMARENRLAEEFARLFRYIKNYWINKVTPEALSVFGQAMRTNNSVESFYHKMNSRIGGPHPSVYRFLGKLKDINLAEEREYRQILGNVQVARRRKRVYIIQEERIRNTQRELIQGEKTVREFLYSLKCTVSSLEGRLRTNDPLFEHHPQSPAEPAHLQRNEHEDQQDNQPITPPEDLETQAEPPSHPSCVVCLDEQPTRAVVPCGHCVCGNCANTLWNEEREDGVAVRCPVCRGNADMFMELFL